MRKIFTCWVCISIVSCGFLKTPPSNEPDLGVPSKQFEVKIQGNEIYKMINLPITNDTIKNLIIQLGKHTYSTSRDQYNPYARTGMYLYYEFEGIRLVFNGPDAGSNEKEKVMSLIKEYPKGYLLEQIDIETNKYRGVLPKTLQTSDSPGKVQSKLGVADSFFYSNIDGSRPFQFIYPNHGLQIRFNFSPGYPISDSIINMIIITDSITEMKRFPTKFPQYQDDMAY